MEIQIKIYIVIALCFRRWSQDHGIKQDITIDDQWNRASWRSAHVIFCPSRATRVRRQISLVLSDVRYCRLAFEIDKFHLWFGIAVHTHKEIRIDLMCWNDWTQSEDRSLLIEKVPTLRTRGMNLTIDGLNRVLSAQSLVTRRSRKWVVSVTDPSSMKLKRKDQLEIYRIIVVRSDGAQNSSQTRLILLYFSDDVIRYARCLRSDR